MQRKVILFLFICFFCKVGAAQQKFPAYIFQSKNDQGIIFCFLNKSSKYNTIVFQLFEDSTFTLTIHKRVPSFIPNEIVTTRRGSYVQHRDTFFLNGSISKAYPFVKEQNHFKELVKEYLWQLFPAKIILTQGGAAYCSYLNISRKLVFAPHTYAHVLEMHHKDWRKNYAAIKYSNHRYS